MAAVPLSSGRTWEADPSGNFVAASHMNELVWVRDVDDHPVRAKFKAVPSQIPQAVYAIGMERVAYTLAQDLGLPVPPVYLEEFEGKRGTIMLRISDNARTYQQALGGAPMLLTEILDEDRWALYVLFDLWIANYDRSGRNFMVEPDPPDRQPTRAVRCRTWLIDNGVSGLWWPRKFDPALGADDVERINVGSGDLTDEANERLRSRMPDRYRRALVSLSEAERKPFLDVIAAIADDRVEAAVTEVPNEYISARAKELTIRMLVARRDRIDTLASDVFPP